MRAILTYHSIDDSGSPVSCHPEAFARHVEWLASGRVRVTTIDDLVQLPAGADAVALTFDDGFVNFGEVAAPRLLDRGLPVTVFVVADLAGTANTWDAGPNRVSPELPLLDWSALVRLQERGVTLGAHSRTHPDLTRLDPSALDEEVRGCADRMEERSGRRPDVFAYPYGQRDGASTQAVARTFRWACTTEFRTLETPAPPVALPRLDMYYFQQPRSLDDWGTARFNARITVRSGLRRARKLATALTAGPGAQTS
ncbi:MAG: polysaccharide deacetylase family protein [Vicinamibacterales bacterium]